MTEGADRLDRISDYLKKNAAEIPDAPATRHNGETLTYQQLDEKVDACAKALIANSIGRGDCVATLCSPCPDFLITFLAAASIGAVWLGLNPKYTPAEYEYVISDAKPKIIFLRSQIGSRHYLDEFEALSNQAIEAFKMVLLDPDASAQRQVVGYQDFVVDGYAVSPENLREVRQGVSPSDAALLVYTSGTTGKPKGALLPHRGLVTCCKVQARYWRADPVRILNFLPINHVGCVGDISSFILVCGGCNIFMEQFDAKGSLKAIAEERVTIWGGIPTTIQMTLDVPDFADFDLSSVQLIAWSGAPASTTLIERMQQVTENLSTSYGLTETVGSVTYVPPGSSFEHLSQTIGQVPSEYEVKLIDAEGGEVDPGCEGEICVRGDFIMLGYLNRPEATDEAIDKDGWLHTGDVAIKRADGLFELVGRKKEMFKSGGYNVYPREIEIALESHPSIAMAAVIGVPDPVFSEVGYAFVLPEVGQNPTARDLVDHCRKTLANYKVPKSFVIENTLPLLPIGKIDKPALKARLKA